MSGAAWAQDDATARAAGEVATMTRGQLVARLTFLAPALTDDGLRAVVVAAMTAPQRPLDTVALAEAQRSREGGVGAFFGRWPGDEGGDEVLRAMEGCS